MTALLSSCANSKKPLVVKTEYAQIERTIYPRPAGVKAVDLHVDAVNGDKPYVAYDEHNYIVNSLYMQKLLRWAKSMSATLTAYENDVKAYNKRLKLQKTDSSESR